MGFLTQAHESNEEFRKVFLDAMLLVSAVYHVGTAWYSNNKPSLIHHHFYGWYKHV